MRGPKLALAWARDQIARPSQDWTQLCLAFTRQAYGLPPVHPSAKAAWEAAEHKHPTTDASSIPFGVPVFWRVGRYWHVAPSAGGGRVISTDVRRRGKPDLVTIDSVSTAWGATLLGWTEDLNGSTVWRRSKPVANRVRAARNALREARHLVREATQLLDAAPEERDVVHAVADSLDDVVAKITRKLERLPKS